MTVTEENYLKAIYALSLHDSQTVSTTAIAKELDSSPASVTEMIKKLSTKSIVDYQPYNGVKLTSEGSHLALALVRKHRLWETFLVSELGFSWDRVHDIAEQLEHVKSDELIDRLDQYLGFPKFDPHGDPIPSANGKLTLRSQLTLDKSYEKVKYKIVGVRSQEDVFLKYLDDLQMNINTVLTVLRRHSFDDSVEIELENAHATISKKVAENLFIQKIEA